MTEKQTATQLIQSSGSASTDWDGISLALSSITCLGKSRVLLVYFPAIPRVSADHGDRNVMKTQLNFNREPTGGIKFCQEALTIELSRGKQLDCHGGIERSQPILIPSQLADRALLQAIPSNLNPAKTLGHLLLCPDDHKKTIERSAR